jgi:hypothetical protein
VCEQALDAVKSLSPVFICGERREGRRRLRKQSKVDAQARRSWKKPREKGIESLVSPYMIYYILHPPINANLRHSERRFFEQQSFSMSLYQSGGGEGVSMK